MAQRMMNRAPSMIAVRWMLARMSARVILPMTTPMISAATTATAAASAGVMKPKSVPPRMMTGSSIAGIARTSEPRKGGMSSPAPPGWSSR